MKKVKYTGPIEGLAGCEAVAVDVEKEDTVSVQFKDVNQRSVSDLVGVRDISDLEQLMFGWHEMPSADFEEVAKAKKPGRVPKAGSDKAGWKPEDG